MLPGSLVISNLQRISLSHTFKGFLIPSESLLNTEDGNWSCIHKECVETAKKANNFWTVSLFGNTLVLELWLFKKNHHISFWKHVFLKYERIKYSATQFSCDLLEKNLMGEGGKACQELQVASCRHCFVLGKCSLWEPAGLLLIPSAFNWLGDPGQATLSSLWFICKNNWILSNETNICENAYWRTFLCSVSEGKQTRWTWLLWSTAINKYMSSENTK